MKAAVQRCGFCWQWDGPEPAQLVGGVEGIPAALLYCDTVRCCQMCFWDLPWMEWQQAGSSHRS
jgi:hypothetical protein